MIRLEDVALSVAGRELLSGASWHVRPGERVALIGPNGCGKTTLLRAMAGERSADEGRIHRRGSARLGYLPQDAVSGSTAPLWDAVRAGADHLLRLEDRLSRAVEALDGAEPADQDKAVRDHARAEEAWAAAGGYAFDERVGTVLHGLGFRKEDWRTPCTRFSGGWQMRIALARLLVGAPEILLLDEPTNHLDLYSRTWLAGFLSQWSGAVVLVSHDRHLLDACVNRVVEIRGRALDRYTGNYSRYLALRDLRDRERAAEIERRTSEIARAQAMVDRFGAKATKSRQAHSRLKRATREAVPEALAREATARLRFKAPETAAGRPRGDRVLILGEVSAGFDGHPPLFQRLTVELHRGERWFLLGPNGGGKTTLLKIMAGAMRPAAGYRELADRARLGWYEQDQARALPPDRSGLQHLLEIDPFCPETRARSSLGALGLSGDRALQPIGSLSGGEKSRVALAALTLQPRDLLLLDEPTNHLDVATNAVLADALEAFPGAVVISTHDRHLVERLATHVIRIQNGGFEAHSGVRPEDFEPVRARASAAQAAGGAEPSLSGGAAYKDRKKAQRARQRARKRLASLETLVSELEDELARVDADLGARSDQPAAVASLLAERAALDARLEAAMADWEAAAEAAEA